jgi:hypothetical protein
LVLTILNFLTKKGSNLQNGHQKCMRFCIPTRRKIMQNFPIFQFSIFNSFEELDVLFSRRCSKCQCQVSDKVWICPSILFSQFIFNSKKKSQITFFCKMANLFSRAIFSFFYHFSGLFFVNLQNYLQKYKIKGNIN